MKYSYSQQSMRMAWFMFFIGGLFIAMQFILQSSSGSIVKHLMHDFNINALSVGVLSSSFFYSYISLQIPSGILIDRFGVKIVLMISTLICCAACLLFSYSHSLHLAILSKILLGIGATPSVVGTLNIAHCWFAKRQFAMLVGFTEMFGMLGGAIGSGLFAFWVEVHGWRHAMIECSIAFFILTILCCIFIQDRHKETVIPASPSKKSIFQHLKLVLHMPQVWFAGLYSGLLFALIQAFSSLWSTPFITKTYHLSITQAASATSLTFLGAAVGGPLVGYLTGHYGHRKLAMFISALLAFITLSCIIYLTTQPVSVLLIELFLLGLFSGAYVVPFAIVKELVPPHTNATAMGFTNMMCITLGAPLQPLIAWLLVHHWDGTLQNNIPAFSVADFQFALLPLLFCFVTAGVLLLFIKDHH